jgi:hypothetical protein
MEKNIKTAQFLKKTVFFLSETLKSIHNLHTRSASVKIVFKHKKSAVTFTEKPEKHFF